MSVSLRLDDDVLVGPAPLALFATCLSPSGACASQHVFGRWCFSLKANNADQSSHDSTCGASLVFCLDDNQVVTFVHVDGGLTSERRRRRECSGL